MNAAPVVSADRPACDALAEPQTSHPLTPHPSPLELIEDQVAAMRLGVDEALAARFQQLEATIDRGLRDFVDVGAALKEIHDGQLYKPTYGTWEVYCRDRWGFSRRRGYQIIAAVEMRTAVHGKITERRARALNAKPPLPRTVIRIDAGRVVVHAAGDVAAALRAAVRAWRRRPQEAQAA